MKKLFEEVEKITGLRALDEKAAMDQLESLAYEGQLQKVDENVLRQSLANLAFKVISSSCGGSCVDAQTYCHKKLDITIRAQDIESGLYISDPSLETDDWEWWDFYFDAAEGIAEAIKRRKVFR